MLTGVETGRSVLAMTTTKAPADETYNALCLRHAALLKEAGAMLGQSLRGVTPHPDVSRKIAEEFATEANEVADQMTVWRLANGYDA